MLQMKLGLKVVFFTVFQQTCYNKSNILQSEELCGTLWMLLGMSCFYSKGKPLEVSINTQNLKKETHFSTTFKVSKDIWKIIVCST